MSIVGEGMMLAAGNLDAITPGLIFIFVGVVIIAFLVAWDTLSK